MESAGLQGEAGGLRGRGACTADDDGLAEGLLAREETRRRELLAVSGRCEGRLLVESEGLRFGEVAAEAAGVLARAEGDRAGVGRGVDAAGEPGVRVGREDSAVCCRLARELREARGRAGDWREGRAVRGVEEARPLPGRVWVGRLVQTREVGRGGRLLGCLSDGDASRRRAGPSGR